MIVDQHLPEILTLYKLSCSLDSELFNNATSIDRERGSRLSVPARTMGHFEKSTNRPKRKISRLRVPPHHIIILLLGHGQWCWMVEPES